MEGTPRTRRVEPAVGTAATHLAVDHDAGGPGSVALVTVLTGHGRGLAGDVGEQGLDVAASLQIELLLGAALLGQTHARLAGQALGQRALDRDVLVSRLQGETLGGVGRHVVGAGPLDLGDLAEVGMLVGVHHGGVAAGQDAGGGAQIHLLLLLLLGLLCCGGGGSGGGGLGVEVVVVVMLRLGVVDLVLGRGEVLLQAGILVGDRVGLAGASPGAARCRGRFSDFGRAATRGLDNSSSR